MPVFEAYIYLPVMQQCYEAYTRGPCAPGHYLVLPKNSVVPGCLENPCVRDNFVWFREKCYELDKPGPCVWGEEISNVVGVNETTLEIMCTKDYKIEVLPRFCDDENKTMSNDGTGGNGYTPTPPQIPEEPSPIKDGKYSEKKCFVGGRRWLVNKRIVYENFNSNYESCNVVSPPTSDPQMQANRNIQDIFSRDLSSA